MRGGLFQLGRLPIKTSGHGVTTSCSQKRKQK